MRAPIAGPVRDRYAADIARVTEQLGGGLSLPIDPENIDLIRAHMRGENEDEILKALSRFLATRQ